jgi:hypothetical protein
MNLVDHIQIENILGPTCHVIVIHETYVRKINSHFGFIDHQLEVGLYKYFSK